MLPVFTKENELVLMNLQRPGQSALYPLSLITMNHYQFLYMHPSVFILL